LHNVDAFEEALEKEIILRGKEIQGPLQTLYWGGGTPSFLPIRVFSRIMLHLRRAIDLTKLKEFTLECNPEDVSADKLRLWQKAGVNRISLGVQSFQDIFLKAMRRNHNAAAAHNAIGLMQDAGFKNFSIDLMFGYEHQTVKDLAADLQTALQTNAPHISIYQLTIEKGTPLHYRVQKERYALVDEETQATFYLQIADTLTRNGYVHYEISNFAKPGAQSMHNSNYWHRKPYLGLGPAAHSFNGNVRSANTPHLKTYIEKLRQGLLPMQQETLLPSELHNESVMLGLRTAEGINLSEFAALHGAEAADRILEISQAWPKEVLRSLSPSIALNTNGFAVADDLSSRLFI
jgi:oxygen-independent coproporphyrinogen-3 oxidase